MEFKKNKDRILFGAYTPLVMDKVDEEQVKTIAEGGIHYALLGYDTFFTMPLEKRIEIIGWCEKYDVEVVIHDRAVLVNYSDVCRENFDKSKAEYANWYASFPNFAGNSLVDEPGTEAFEVLGKSVEDYMEIFPNKQPWINLLPMYANTKQLTGGAWMASIEYYETPDTSYQQYLDEYIDKVPTDYICVDIYPCHHVNGIKKTYKGYVKNIEMVADACRKSGREFWVCLQSCTWSPENVRIPDEADMRWQVYTMMSYGVKNCLYYVYAYLPNHFGTPIDENGNKTPLWYICKDIYEELDNYASVFSLYKNLGAYSHNNSKATPYLNMDNPYRGVKVISEIVCEDALLIGYFEKKEGKGSAFTLVNMSDLVLNKSVDIKLKINGEIVTAYINGQANVLIPEDGYYKFDLESGNGVFVTVE